MPTNPQDAAEQVAKKVVREFCESRGWDAAFLHALEPDVTTALTEARSAALKEAAAMVRDSAAEREHEIADGGSGCYYTCPKCQEDELAASLERMAGGAEDTSTDVSATPDREQG